MIILEIRFLGEIVFFSFKFLDLMSPVVTLTISLDTIGLEILPRFESLSLLFRDCFPTSTNNITSVTNVSMIKVKSENIILMHLNIFTIKYSTLSKVSL